MRATPHTHSMNTKEPCSLQLETFLETRQYTVKSSHTQKQASQAM